MNFIQSINMSPESSIREAFEVLSDTFGMVITIVDQQGKLIGIVSVGDLRKGLLVGKGLDDKLKTVMNRSPVTVLEDDISTVEKLSELKLRLDASDVGEGQRRELFAVPVVTAEQYVKGLTTLKILETRSVDYTAKETYHPDSPVPYVLVIGGAGYIGSVLVGQLLDLGWRVRVVDNLTYSKESIEAFIDNQRFEFVNGDICDLNVQVNVIESIDFVVFLAEIVGDPSCEYVPEKAFKTNFLSVSSMATVCDHMQISRFIYTSSCSVYGACNDMNHILTETSELYPVSHYARMKIASEEALFSRKNDLFSPTILRLATVFGVSPRPRFDLVVNTFARNAYFDGEITVYGGNQWRPNVHVADVAKSIISVLRAPLNEVSRRVFNVGNSRANHTIMELAESTKTVFPDTVIKVDGAVVDERNYRVDFSRANNGLGVDPQISVIEGLMELRSVFELGTIKEPYSETYSNILALKEYSRA